MKKIWDASGAKGEFLHVGINDFDKEADFVTVLGKEKSHIDLSQSTFLLTYTCDELISEIKVKEKLIIFQTVTEETVFE